MKKLSIILYILIFWGCQQVENPSPTQNDVLNSVTNSNAKKQKPGILQDGVDEWMEKSAQEKPKQSKQEISKTKDGKKKGYLQSLIDETSVSDKKEKTPSHVKELESMPVIGK